MRIYLFILSHETGLQTATGLTYGTGFRTGLINSYMGQLIVWPRLPGRREKGAKRERGRPRENWRHPSRTPLITQHPAAAVCDPASVIQQYRCAGSSDTYRRWCHLWTLNAAPRRFTNGGGQPARLLQQERSHRSSSGRPPGTESRHSCPSWVTPVSRKTWDPPRFHPQLG